MKCKICNENDISGNFSFCESCIGELSTKPKVHLVLAYSENSQWGEVRWCKNSIGGIGKDAINNGVPVGIWGIYGDNTYWVSLCKELDALHDMMTQYFTHVDREQLATYSRSRRVVPDKSNINPDRNKVNKVGKVPINTGQSNETVKTTGDTKLQDIKNRLLRMQEEYRRK